MSSSRESCRALAIARPRHLKRSTVFLPAANQCLRFSFCPWHPCMGGGNTASILHTALLAATDAIHSHGLLS